MDSFHTPIFVVQASVDHEQILDQSTASMYISFHIRHKFQLYFCYLSITFLNRKMFLHKFLTLAHKIEISSHLVINSFFVLIIPYENIFFIGPLVQKQL